MKSLPRFVPNHRASLPLIWSGFALWVVLLFTFSNQPGQAGPEHPIFYKDKLEHIAFFAMGAIFLAAALRRSFFLRWRTVVLISLVTLVVLGALDEINQLHVPGRSGGDVFDWLADLLGSATGLVILRRFYGEEKIPGRPDCGIAQGDRAA